MEDTFQQDQEKDKENPGSKSDIKGEDNAVEMTEDFDGKMHDGELEEQGLTWLVASCFEIISILPRKPHFPDKKKIYCNFLKQHLFLCIDTGNSYACCCHVHRGISSWAVLGKSHTLTSVVALACAGCSGARWWFLTELSSQSRLFGSLFLFSKIVCVL